MAKRKYANPAEEAYKKGRQTMTAEETIGLPKQINRPRRSKTMAKGLVRRRMKELAYGSRAYERTPKEELLLQAKLRRRRMRSR